MEIHLPNTTPFNISDSGGAKAKIFPQNFCCMLAPTDCEHCAVAPEGQKSLIVLPVSEYCTTWEKLRSWIYLWIHES